MHCQLNATGLQHNYSLLMLKEIRYLMRIMSMHLYGVDVDDSDDDSNNEVNISQIVLLYPRKVLKL